MGLDRGRVVREALGLLDEVGLEGLTLRRLARELDVKAPALYWHFENKRELLDEMATTMLRGLVEEMRALDPDQHWTEWMAGTARDLRGMLLGYRDGAKVFSGMYLTDDSLLGSMEIPLRKLNDAGFSLRDAVVGWSTVYSYTVGFVIEEQTVYPREGERDERYDPARRAERIDAEEHPLAVAAGEETFTGFDERFERGLALIISGIEHSLPRDR